jgi:hypothetical protein
MPQPAKWLQFLQNSAVGNARQDDWAGRTGVCLVARQRLLTSFSCLFSCFIHRNKASMTPSIVQIHLTFRSASWLEKTSNKAARTMRVKRARKAGRKGGEHSHGRK